MTIEYKRFPLDTRALEYVRERLSEGPKLGRLLLSREDLDRGRIWTRLPAETDLDSLYELTLGGKLPVSNSNVKYGISPHGSIHRMTPVPNSDADLAEVISRFLENHVRGAAVFENQLFRPDAPWLTRVASQLAFGGDVTFHVLCAKTELERIGTTIREAKSPTLLGVLTDALTDASAFRCDASGYSVCDDDIRDLALAADAIIVGAYDGEGYVVWEKP